MQRTVAVFGDARYARLSTISAAPLYRLRPARSYEMRRRHGTKTRGHGVPRAERRAPMPENRPGFPHRFRPPGRSGRGVGGPYPISAIDSVTEPETRATCELA